MPWSAEKWRSFNQVRKVILQTLQVEYGFGQIVQRLVRVHAGNIVKRCNELELEALLSGTTPPWCTSDFILQQWLGECDRLPTQANQPVDIDGCILTGGQLRLKAHRMWLTMRKARLQALAIRAFTGNKVWQPIGCMECTDLYAASIQNWGVW